MCRTNRNDDIANYTRRQMFEKYIFLGRKIESSSCFVQNRILTRFLKGSMDSCENCWGERNNIFLCKFLIPNTFLNKAANVPLLFASTEPFSSGVPVGALAEHKGMTCTVVSRLMHKIQKNIICDFFLKGHKMAYNPGKFHFRQVHPLVTVCRDPSMRHFLSEWT